MQLITSAWDLLGVALVFTFGLFVVLMLKRMFGATTNRAVLLYIWHTVFCVLYAQYVILNGGDALYYYSNAVRGDVEFSLGTAAVSFLAVFFVSFLNLSFLGTFFAYNIFGVIGLLAFDASLRYATFDKKRWVKLLSTLVVFLPSVSFWSSALGKDSLSFLATGLALWASINLPRRILLMVIAVTTMLLVRPHVAGMLVIALSGAMLLQRQLATWKKICLVAVVAATAAILVPFGLQYAGVGAEASIGNLRAYVEQRQSYNLEGGGAVDIASLSFPMQLFTYAFRPLPNEAGSLFAAAAALDNVILLLVCLLGVFAGFKRKKVRIQGNRVFLWLYCIVAWSILATTTANLGISVRQKWMFIPMLLFLLFSIMGPHGRLRRTNQSPLIVSRT